jgi:hypothetical protein
MPRELAIVRLMVQDLLMSTTEDNPLRDVHAAQRLRP